MNPFTNPSIDPYRLCGRMGLLLFLVVTFGISHNLAWLNPFPDQPPSIVTLKSIPYGWEWDLDSGLEIHSAVDFPEEMVRIKERIERPLKNAVLSVPIALVDAFVPLTKIQKYAFSYLLHHLMNVVVMASCLWLMFWLARRHHIPAGGVLLCWVWLLFKEPTFWLNSHTYVFQIAETVFALAMLQRVADLAGRVVGIRYMLVVCLYAFASGLLILVKSVLAPFLAIGAFLLIRRRYKEVILCLAVFPLPFVLYRALLLVVGIPWFAAGVQLYGQGGWFFDAIHNRTGLWHAMGQMLGLSVSACASFLGYYGPVVWFVALVGFALGCLARDGKGSLCLLFFLLFAANIAQAVFAARVFGYMFLDSFIAISFLFAWGYEWLCSRRSIGRWMPLAAGSYLAFHIVYSLWRYVHLPWLSPYEQLHL